MAGKLIYIANVTLDFYIEDATGSFGFTEPTEDVFVFITDLIRPAGTYLYGRRMYETMAVWETDPSLAAQSEREAEFARVWKGADKVVFSTTLDAPSTERTRIERSFDADAVRDWKRSATADFGIGGANVAAQAFAAGLVDECHFFVSPIAVGAGKPAMPTETRVNLRLVDERRFEDVVYLRYDVNTDDAG